MSASSTEIITAWATLGLGVVTIIIAAVAIWQGMITRRALGEEEKGTREAARSRIDQRAPLITVFAEVPGSMTAEWLTPLQPGTSFSLPSDAGLTFAVTGWFLVTNEGRSTGIVDIPAGILEFDPDDMPISGLNALSAYPQPKAHHQFRLRSGESKRLFIEIRKTLDEWVRPNATSGESGTKLTITVSDTFSDGLYDKTELCIVGTPVSPDNCANRWVPSTTPSHLVVNRTVRYYLSVTTKKTKWSTNLHLKCLRLWTYITK